MLVPTLRVGMPYGTLRVPATRPLPTTRSVEYGVPTETVGTSPDHSPSSVVISEETPARRPPRTDRRAMVAILSTTGSLKARKMAPALTRSIQAASP